MQSIERCREEAIALEEAARERSKKTTELFNLQLQGAVSSLESARECLSSFIELGEQRFAETGSSEGFAFTADFSEATSTGSADVSATLLAAVKGSTGVAASIAAYSTVGAVGAASTGASIATLSGAAATNATLAWFGGGALAAGGGGMAVGMGVLGALAAAPVAFAGAEYASKHYKKRGSSSAEELIRIQREYEEKKAECSLADQVSERLGTKIAVFRHIVSRANHWVSLVRSFSDVGSTQLVIVTQAFGLSMMQLEEAFRSVIQHAVVDEQGQLTAPLDLDVDEIVLARESSKWSI
ncbi:hypothetical protein EYC98_18620 [Halieaceae bacterium IMCC14734]|uniref:Uncharacterized protein n=1 Tax=Candidatus Litorirhabdus singularis TaxID=2518993 RepID=A0ABT3TKT3_9GAMM|nr:hypothetical protein [Candidatus Litorirhabdus singularis]MCX2982881.1 hypothetical protein [Candidatus Litorirhabdus singularis]